MPSVVDNPVLWLSINRRGAVNKNVTTFYIDQAISLFNGTLKSNKKCFA